MAVIVYGICLVIATLVTLWMATKDYENIDRYYWSIAILIPIIILGYWLKTMVVTEEAAAITFCFIYLDSTVLPTIMIFIILHILDIHVKSWIKYIAYGIAMIHLFIVWGCIHNDLYFKKIKLVFTDWGTVTQVYDGPIKIYHYWYLGVLLTTILVLIVIGFIRKGRYSRFSLILYTIITLIGAGCYALEWTFHLKFSLLPFLYTLSNIIIALQYDRIHMHEISSIMSEHHKHLGSRGYAVFDLNGRFLSCNHQIYKFWPELATQRVDEYLPKDSSLQHVFYSMIESYNTYGNRLTKFQINDVTCTCEITPFSLNKEIEIQGYLFEARDTTQEQKNINLITSYNESLNEQVELKTQNILEMQSKIVTGMANMIENRDLNTGGHVKRTSDIIRIIIDEIIRQNALSINEEFANDIVRAAPMHDLGKITVENAILNKPAKLTDEEYEIMKKHAPKSGEMVMLLLDGVEEDHFVQMAYHVARFHHERWDGGGYPDHLVGSMIPLEARIMAVADVYDALASKRSYKDAMDPKLVAKIMLEGMGTQFDPRMKPIFLGCRGKLEAYYAKANRE